MEVILIKTDCEEWKFIHKWLSEHPLNQNLPEPNIALNEGEYWQYICSFRHNDKVIHQLRHLHHPYTHRVESISVNASEAFNEESILPKK